MCVDPSDPASLTDFTISCFEVFLPRLPLSRTPRVKISPDFNIRVVMRRLFSRRATRSARDTPGLEVIDTLADVRVGRGIPEHLRS